MSNAADQLIVQLKGEIIQTLPLTTSVISIGRSPENGLSLPHQMVSRIHAELRMATQRLTLTDLGSFNGTFIGTQRLVPNQPHMLEDGATFHIGPFLLTYQIAKLVASQQANDDEMLPEQEDPTFIEQPIEESPPAVHLIPQPVKLVYEGVQDKADSIYSRFLPDIFQENDFLRRLLHIFQDIWEPLEQRQDHIEMYFDPCTCPVSFLPWLASWLDLPFNHQWTELQHRRLLAQAMELYSWQGTCYGLIRIIEVCTGLTPVITESTAQPFVFHIHITLPRGDAGEKLDKNLIQELICTHKPAYAGYTLEVT